MSISIEHDIQSLRRRAYHSRELILDMARSASKVHVGGALSAIDIMTVLYFHTLRIHPQAPEWAGRDYFILSKGHGCAALYVTLASRGYFAEEELETYAMRDSRLAGHPMCKLPGVEFSTGSLGHGLSLGVGVALAAQRDGLDRRTFVLLGDGELQEGSVWEAMMAGASFGLDNLIAIVDRNGLQICGPTEQQIRLEPLADRWRSFGWEVVDVDGHDHDALVETFDRLPLIPGRPTAVIARTVKGKGVRFLENQKKSHCLTLTPPLYQRAKAQLRAGAQP